MGSGVVDLNRLRFKEDAVDRDLAPDLGDGFQRFAFELLRRGHPALRAYPAAGRDGGIDLIEDGEDGRRVYECKHIGADGDGPARSRWQGVARNLRKHLPGRSQSQYSPWWEVDPPIRAYTLCISSTLSNQSQVESLRKEIKEVFVSLGDEHEHLRHLRDVDVQVMHWPELHAELGDAPDLLLKWFPQSRPLGLVPLDRPELLSPFASFLDSAKLGYYSRDRHIVAHGRPKGIEVETEMEVLNRLAQTVGLIVTGAGGHGKTRLVHELGLLAQREEWCVLRVSGSWRRESVDRLSAMAGPSTRFLLLLDYVEIQQGFNDAVNDLVDVHETYGLQIKYIANCRSSFYPRVAHLPQHEEVPLAPSHGVEWFREFRHAIVRHILEAGGVGVEPRTLQVCRDVPVLAVFLSYLSATGRADDLHDLLNEKDFGKWVLRRLERSFPGTPSYDIAGMVAQFPMREDLATQLTPLEVLGTLEKDGWIEQQATIDPTQEGREWSVVHDVLADQLLVSSLAERGRFAGAEVEKLVVSGLANGTLASLISSLQRIRDRPEVEDVSFGAIVLRQFAADPHGWIAQTPNILASSLLEPADAIAMLESNRQLWRGQLSRNMVRRQIGWLAREVAGDPESEPARAVLQWLQWSLDIEETDYLLRSGLLLSPASTAARAKAWIEARQIDFATHFVINAWLSSTLPSEEIAGSVQAWLEVHGAHSRAWHVLGSWLAGEGGAGAVEEFVSSWLELHHEARLGGSVVLFSWLKAGGSLDVVNRYAIRWLEVNGAAPQASYVLGSWIEAGADLDTAAPFMEQWLHEHWRLLDARFVFISWVNRGGSTEAVREIVEKWLDLHAGRQEAWHALEAAVKVSPEKATEALAGILDSGEVDAGAEEFGAVLTGWLLGGGSLELIQPYLDEWLSRFGETLVAGGVHAARLEREEDPPAEVKAAAVSWFLAFPTDLQAGYLSKLFVLDDEAEPKAIRAILLWCTAFPEHEDALWRLTQLRTNLRRIDVNEEVLKAAEAVSEVALNEPEMSTLRSTQLTTLCSLLVGARAFQTGIGADRCDAIVLNWVRHPRSFEHGEVRLSNAERPGLIRRILALFLRGWMDASAEADAAALERMLSWVRSWGESPDRDEALRAIDQVAALRPAAQKT